MKRTRTILASLLSGLVAVSGFAGEANAKLNGRLVGLLHQIERHYGKPVIISSGCRSRGQNRRAGGAESSFHLRCMAADIKVAGVSKGALLHFARSLPGRGGIGSYCRNSIVHIDVGPRREWFEGCGFGRPHRHAFNTYALSSGHKAKRKRHRKHKH